jgi:hypothetical protein
MICAPRHVGASYGRLKAAITLAAINRGDNFEDVLTSQLMPPSSPRP